MYRYYSPLTDKNEGRTVIVGNLKNKFTLEIAVSHCSNKDVFVKKRGKHIAEGRLLSRGGRLLYCIYNISYDDDTTFATEDFIQISIKINQEIVKTKKLFTGTLRSYIVPKRKSQLITI